MIAAALTDDAGRPLAVRTSTMPSSNGATPMRFALGLILLWFGGMKFTGYEAAVIAPLIANSPLVGWLHGVFGIQGASNFVGVFEIVAGVLLLMRAVSARLAVVGAAMAVVTFLVTLSFFFSTAGVGEPLAGGFPALSAVPGQFLLKDLGLLGIALFLFGDALHAASSKPAHATLGRLRNVGSAVLRYGLALIFLWFGAMKFTDYEATGIAGMVANSPFLAWLHAVAGIRGASVAIGVFEVATGILLLVGGVTSRFRIVAALMAVVTFVVTVTLLFTTPGVAAPDGFPVLSGDLGQFLLKDVGLLAIAIALLLEAWGERAALRRAVPDARSPRVA